MDTGGTVVDQAYVISDLHLGGESPFQMFKEGAALVAFIRGLLPAAGSMPQRVALVINGDFVDFLAESPARHFDAEGALKKIQRIAADPAFIAVFDALRAFLRVPGYRLGIVLGNHDLELVLPWVQRGLQEILSCGDEAAIGRILWSLDGQGLLLSLDNPSGPRILCVHGNEVDGWNVADHEKLRRLARDGLRGRAPREDYVPNAGSRMVIEVMNGIKRRYPFVDLLKPETKAVIPTLMVLDPSAAKLLLALPALVGRQQLDQGRIGLGLLGEIDGARPSPLSLEVGLAPESIASLAATKNREQIRGELMNAVEDHYSRGLAAADLLDAQAPLRTLGLVDAALEFVRSRDRVEALRVELAELADDRSFSTLDRDPTFIDMHARVSTNIDFLVTGHTHLARAIEREFGRAYYFNTGTWARVVRITGAALADADQFRRVYDVLASGRMEALDTAEGLEAVRPHLAAFWTDADGHHGELREVPAGPPYVPQPVYRTKYTRR